MDDFTLALAREVQGRYYGKRRGFVADNRDPDHLGRVKLQIPSILGDQVTDWALPCVPFGGKPDQGWFAVPEVGAQVWVEFEEGDVHKPIWTGTFWQKKDDVPKDAQKEQPTTRLLRTPSGHAIQFDDEKGKERVRLVHAAGAEVTLDEKGTLRLTDAKGAAVILDAENQAIQIEDTHGNTIKLEGSGTSIADGDGNTIELSSSGVTIKSRKIVIEGDQVMLGGAGGEPVIKGTSFLQLFATHVHTASPGGGPTSPPMPQGEATSLSRSVMVK